MGVRETEECEKLEISLTRYEVDTSQTLDLVSTVDGANRQQPRERTPSPTSLEKSLLPSSNDLSNSNHPIPTTKKKQSNPPSPIPSVCNTPAFSTSMVIIFFITVIIFGAIIDSFLHYQRDKKGCEMSYMRPSYVKQHSFDSEQTKFSGKYGLYLYREGGYDLSDEPTGIPALFIPGNAGSYKQVRSIAARTSAFYYESIAKEENLWEHGVRNIDFFTVDFNEEFSALHGYSLLEQTEYLNDAIRYILSLYPTVRKHQYSHPSQPHPDPTSVIIIGHSMGGVVARMLFTMPNYQPGSINTILTMATPHLLPPAPFDWQISKIYADINEFWRNGYSNNVEQLNSLTDVTLISIAGGNLDTVVCSDSANINSIVPASHGFTVFTTSIPNVWTSTDHQSILWCNQLVKVVTKALLNIVDVRRTTQTKSTTERMRVFRKELLSGFEEPPAEIGIPNSKREPFGIINLEKDSHTFLNIGQRLVLRRLGVAEKIHLMPIPPPAPNSSFNTSFSLLTDESLGKNSRIDVLLCDVMPTEVPELHDEDLLANELSLPTAPRLSCHIASKDSFVIPASTKHDQDAFSGRTFSFLNLKVKDLVDYQYIAIKDYDGSGTDGFLIAEFHDEQSTITTIDASMKDLLLSGIHIDLPSENYSLLMVIRIPVIDSSLLTYRMSVSRPGCDVGQLFAPFVRQSISSMYESKFLVNIKKAGIDMHGQAPFVTPVSAPHLWKGLELQFWMDPTCDGPFSLGIELDLYGSLGKFVMRFHTVLIVFPFIVVIMTLRTQLNEYNSSERYFSFGYALTLFTRKTLPKLLLTISVLSIYQSITHASSAYSLADLFPMDSTSGAKSSFNVNDTLLGNYDPFFWFLPPLFFLMGVGITFFCWLLLASLVRILASIATFINRRAPWFARLVGRSQKSVTSRFRRRVITIVILFVTVASFVPHQFAFVVAFLVHIVSCIRSLVDAQSLSKQSKLIQKRWEHYHYLQTILIFLFMLLPFNVPALMVWIRNLSVHWFASFSSDHSILAIAPIVFYVEIVTGGKMLPRTTDRVSNFITGSILTIITICALLYGVRYTYLLYFSSLCLILWLIILHTGFSWVGKAMGVSVKKILKRNKKCS